MFKVVVAVAFLSLLAAADAATFTFIAYTDAGCTNQLQRITAPTGGCTHDPPLFSLQHLAPVSPASPGENASSGFCR